MSETKINASDILGGEGESQPYFEINKFKVPSLMMKYFSIDSTGPFPTCFVVITTVSGKFLSAQFPKDNDVLSLYLRSKHSLFNPPRIDFLITKIEGTLSNDPEGDRMTYLIYGVTNIPTLRAETSYIIKDATSYEALMKIANLLGLGFATNEKIDNMNDKMNWICAYQTYDDWIRSIVGHAYSDINNFYDWWVDIYHNLNFINVNIPLSISDDYKPLDGLLKNPYTNYRDNENERMGLGKIQLSNYTNLKGRNDFITRFSILNTSGIVSSLNGYRRMMYYYDKDNLDMLFDEIEPSITSDSELTKNVMRDRPNEDYYIKKKKYKFCGIQQSKNVHKNWKFSEMNNFQNNSSYKKISLELHLSDINLNIYRGQVLPVYMMASQTEETIKHSAKIEDKSEDVGFNINRFLSGNYYVTGIHIDWRLDQNESTSVGYFSQVVNVTRREWTVPDTVSTEIKYDTTFVTPSNVG